VLSGPLTGVAIALGLFDKGDRMSNEILRRNNLIAFQNNCCYLCGTQMLRAKKKNDRYLWRTVEHIVPRSLGGNRRGSNLALAHFGCNQKKANRKPFPCEVLLGEVLEVRRKSI
jgi:5-methylcytosine-specific restriction endonuclease McrA